MATRRLRDAQSQYSAWQPGLRTADSPLDALRIERVIAVSRLCLTVIAFASFNVGHVEPASYGRVANILLVLFTAHSVSALLALRNSHPQTATKFALATHAVDLIAAAITLPMAGATNPFFTFFLFVLAAAAFRWGFRETAITTVIAIALALIYARLAATVPSVASLGGQRPFNVVMVQAAYLAMMGLLLGYLAEAGRLLRAEGAIIVDLLGKVRPDAGLTRALTVVGHDLVTVFKASRVVLVLEDVRQHRLFRWDTSMLDDPTGSEGVIDERAAALRDHQAFPQTDYSVAVVRRASIRHGTGVHQITVINALGRAVDAGGRVVTDAFVAAHSFERLITVPVRFSDEWAGRIFVFDPSTNVRLVSQTLFLQRLVRQVGPAVFSTYLLDRLKTQASAIERARVARELHDGVIQSLIGLEMQIHALRSTDAVSQGALAGDLARMQSLVRDEVLNLRDLMQQMRPDEVDPGQLLDHLADMVQRFARDTGTTARFLTELTEVALPRRVCFELLRIVQEGLANVRKHSAATNVIVRFGVGTQGWSLEIADNGRGFPFEGQLPAAELDARHVGPAIIKERVRAIGGRLVVDSAPSRGARLEILVPLGVRE